MCIRDSPFIAYGFACGVHLPLTLGIKVVIIPNLSLIHIWMLS